MRPTIPGVLKASLGVIAFSYDMLLNVTIISEMTCNREVLMNRTLKKSKKWQINCNYTVGNKSWSMTKPSKENFSSKPLSPFEIVHVHVNGTSLFNSELVSLNELTFVAPSHRRTLWYNWRISYSAGNCSAQKKHYTSSCSSIPGSPKIPESPNFHHLLFVTWWMVDTQCQQIRWYTGTGVIFALRCA